MNRRETDALGGMDVPAGAYYGIATMRAIGNFPISGLRPRPVYVEAAVQIKRAAASVNSALGRLDAKKAAAIITAADEILAGGLRDQFVVDVYQAGAGTSHNMNVNEVIANRAIEILGGAKGEYAVVHPNDDVNMAQSTNDVIPTAIRIAALLLGKHLLPALVNLADACALKADAFDGIVKSGRTHLQDAAPIRLGQEFGGYAANIRKHRDAVAAALDACREIGLGGTAVGTGLNAPREYRRRVAVELSRALGERFRTADNYFEAMQSLRPFVGLSGTLRNLAQDLIRIANDLRLLSSGPTTGIGELSLPAVQPGSSIMPGKVNPSVAEMLDMVCFQVLGCDAAVVLAAQAGQLELNVMMPLVAHDLIHEMEILTSAVNVFVRDCVAGISANESRCRAFAEGSMSVVTVLSPRIGYAKAAELAHEYVRSGTPLKKLAVDRGYLTAKEADAVFDLRPMTDPGVH